MKLLYKGSECGVPCTCSAEEEYVWWTLMEGPVDGSGTSWSTNSSDFVLPVVVTPILFRITCSTSVSGVEFRCNTAPVTRVTYNSANLELSGQPFKCFSKEDNAFRILLTGTSGSFSVSDWAIAVSKEDYAKLVEASGS